MMKLQIVLFLWLSLTGASHCFKPNVLFIIVDDLRPALGVYGDRNAYTPNIDAFASKAFVFTNTFAQQALCAPSRNSLLTSRRPDSLHLYDFNSYWRDTVGNFTTLPQYFKENGYYTQSIGKVFHPGASSNFTDDALYSWSGKPFHPTTERYKDSKVCINEDGTFSANLVCPVITKFQPNQTLPDLESLNAALKFLRDKNNITRGKPYFLAVGFHKPHIPMKFPVEYLKYHDLANITLPRNRGRSPSMPVVAWNPWNDVRKRDDIEKLKIPFPFGTISDDKSREIIQGYNAAVSYIDDLIGQLVSKVDLTKTVVVLTSDHGWAYGEHGEWAKYSNYNVATRVPLLIHVPSLNSRSMFINSLTELVDLFPTLVDLTQVAPSLDTCFRNKTNGGLCTEGRSLVPVMFRSFTSTEKLAVFSQYPRPTVFPSRVPDSDSPKLKDIEIMGYSARTLGHRYTEWVKFNHSIFKPDWTTVYGTELYDHGIDPNENLNLATRPEMAFIAKALRKQLILGWRYA